MARANSKSIKNKNLKKINGVTLVGLAGRFIDKINIIDLAIISTDSTKIGKDAKKNKLNFFFLRPNKIAGPKISDEKVLKHGLIEAEKKFKKKFDVIVSIPPTSPLRKKTDAILAIKKLINEKFDAVWTINKIDTKYHPYKSLSIKKNILSFFSRFGKKIKYRQQLNDLYFRNGCCYVFTREAIMNQNILPKNSGFIASKTEQVSIDTLNDLKKVRYISKKTT